MSYLTLKNDHTIKLEPIIRIHIKILTYIFYKNVEEGFRKYGQLSLFDLQISFTANLFLRFMGLLK